MQRAGDALFVVLAGAHGAAILAAPVAPLIAVGIWWNSNTIAHNFVHRPFFRARTLNLLFSAGQSLLMGIPQTLWRERHLAHHAGVRWRLRWSRQLAIEIALVTVLWAFLAAAHPWFFLLTYLPGYVAGLTLCAMQGHYEHSGAGTTSHYGRLYNVLCFNDGYHAEHHAYPGVHWTELPQRAQPGARASQWPALLRWVDGIGLDWLERLVLRSPVLQRLVVNAHRRACGALIPNAHTLRSILIVGGGLFPRSAIVLHELAPRAVLLVVDADAQHLVAARDFIEHSDAELQRAVRFTHAHYVPGDSYSGIDLVVVPLAFRGNRRAIYARPPAPTVLIHDWIWNVRGQSCIVSPWLLKRLNLIHG